MTRRAWYVVETDVVTAPDGRRMVLVQLPEGHLLVTADDARKIATMIALSADDLDNE